MVSTMDSESSDPSSNLGGTKPAVIFLVILSSAVRFNTKQVLNKY